MNRNMMKQAQQLQKQMLQVQQEIEAAKVEFSSGGGAVKVVVSGKMTVEQIVIDPDAVDPEDVEILQDLVLSAVNGGIEKAQELASSKMGAVTGGLNIPGLTQFGHGIFEWGSPCSETYRRVQSASWCRA